MSKACVVRTLSVVNNNWFAQQHILVHLRTICCRHEARTSAHRKFLHPNEPYVRLNLFTRAPAPQIHSTRKQQHKHTHPRTHELAKFIQNGNNFTFARVMECLHTVYDKSSVFAVRLLRVSRVRVPKVNVAGLLIFFISSVCNAYPTFMLCWLGIWWMCVQD